MVRARWRLFGLMAVAMARLILRLERTGAGDVWAKADALEMWVRGAVHILNREIAEASAAGEPACPEEAHALSHMRAIAVAAARARHVLAIGKRPPAAKRRGAIYRRRHAHSYG